MYDLTKSSKNFPTVPDGRYVLNVENVDVEPHTNKDNVEGHHFNIRFKISGGQFDGRKVWGHIYLPGQLFRIKELLEAGQSDILTNTNASAEDIAAAVTGLTVTGFIKNGVTTNNNPRVDVIEFGDKDAPTGQMDDSAAPTPSFLK